MSNEYIHVNNTIRDEFVHCTCSKVQFMNVPGLTEYVYMPNEYIHISNTIRDEFVHCTSSNVPSMNVPCIDVASVYVFAHNGVKCDLSYPHFPTNYDSWWLIDDWSFQSARKNTRKGFRLGVWCNWQVCSDMAHFRVVWGSWTGIQCPFGLGLP